MKFLVESEFQGQGPPRTQETTKTTSTLTTPRVGFGTGGPYIALFGGPTFQLVPDAFSCSYEQQKKLGVRKRHRIKLLGEENQKILRTVKKYIGGSNPVVFY